MSGMEIERKFLVRKGSAYRSAAFSFSHIQQGYIKAEGATVRVRVRDDKAYLTIKSKSVDGGLSRYEFEKEITLDEARQLMKLCRGGVIDKHRYLVKSGMHTFEVDEFHGDNDGVVPPSKSRKIYDILKELGCDVKYTEYENVGHNAWDYVFKEADLFPWLFSHQK